MSLPVTRADTLNALPGVSPDTSWSPSSSSQAGEVLLQKSMNEEVTAANFPR